MKAVLRNALTAALTTAGLAIATQAASQVTFYEQDAFQGRSFTTQQRVRNFERFGFNDRASSAVVQSSRWEVCDDTRFEGNCIVLRPGRYPSLASMGLNDRISSVRAISTGARVAEDRYAPLPVASQVTFFEHQGFHGRSFSTAKPVGNLKRFGFNDRASSAEVVGDRWEVCEDARFSGRCVVLRPGRYASFAAMGLSDRVSSVRAVSGNARIDDGRYAPAAVAGQVSFYEHEGFQGRSFTTLTQIDNFQSVGFNDRASSVDVIGERWEICESASFGGRCVVLRPGRYGSLAAMGLNDRVSSVRAVSSNARIDDHRYAPAPVVARDGRDYRQRNNERTYEANVTSARAVVATPGQRCWVEPGQAVQPQSGISVPGAVVGAVLGGILGHQVGSGSTQNVATIGGAALGGFAGANIGKLGIGQPAQPQNVQRCENIPSQIPTYWEVTYNFRGVEHRMQMTTQPGSTVTVNEQGEPRG